MNIIQYLTVGIHTCFRIKKPPQKKSLLSAKFILCSDSIAENGSASNFQSKTQLPASKNPKIQNFFISFHTSTYKFWPSQKYTIFQSNAHARPTKGSVARPQGQQAQSNNLLNLVWSIWKFVFEFVSNFDIRISDFNHSGCFIQNKPNFQKSQMNVTSFYAVDYENKHLRSRFKNKANSNPIQTQFTGCSNEHKLW